MAAIGGLAEAYRGRGPCRRRRTSAGPDALRKAASACMPRDRGGRDLEEAVSTPASMASVASAWAVQANGLALGSFLAQ